MFPVLIGDDITTEILDRGFRCQEFMATVVNDRLSDER